MSHSYKADEACFDNQQMNYCSTATNITKIPAAKPTIQPQSKNQILSSYYKVRLQGFIL
jgi:hypothetical protein